MIRLSKAAAADLRHIDAWLRPRAGGVVTDRVIEDILSDIHYRIVGGHVVIRRVLHGAMQWPRPKRP